MYNPLDMTGKTILVTGASSGIGRAICVTLDRLGAKIVLVARDRGRLEETVRLTESDRHSIETFDLNEVEAIPGWMKEVAARSGQLDGMVHSAGMLIVRPLRFFSAADFHSVMRLNLESAMQLAKGFRQRGVCQNPASIVFLSSVAATVGNAGMTAYSASKGALQAATRSLALELAGEKICVNCVAPGLVYTELVDNQKNTLSAEQFAAIDQRHPLGVGQASDVANAVAFLLAETGRWITGSTLVIDGGYSAG